MQTTHLLSICSRAAPQRQLFRNHFSVMPQFPRTPPKALPLSPCPAPLHVQPQVLSHLAVSAPPTRLTPELPVPSAGACQQRQNILGKAPRGHCKACPGPGGRPDRRTVEQRSPSLPPQPAERCREERRGWEVFVEPARPALALALFPCSCCRRTWGAGTGACRARGSST